ncbi:uncharacterized protein BJ171DRAFT_485105 [Polychytrium aggregatum]|uniref:uncharacterized protein n=1 Tax=Polychytrium aggregatum TaxID=110093 RepID=UPI0022FE6467|nr:uncharacterized protein BJ171DRAFT_485105 [Polychytrium aggregatum]KAI9209815.1 hypothetical protein BJ171DRAFT_485105 [Polychytrium aggregatum]
MFSKRFFLSPGLDQSISNSFSVSSLNLRRVTVDRSALIALGYTPVSSVMGSSFSLAPRSAETLITPIELSTIERIAGDFLDNELAGLGLDFAVWEWTSPQLQGLLLGLFLKLDLIPSDPVLLAEFIHFLVDVEKGYKANPYHSFHHAVDVLYTLFFMLTDLGLADAIGFTKLEINALLIAALTHDILHPGLNNLFQINAQTDLAKRYNNVSVLENFSLDHAEFLLHKHPVLRKLNLSPERIDPDDASQPNPMTRIVVEAILSTDMSKHFTLLSKLIDKQPEETTDISDFDSTPTSQCRKEGAPEDACRDKRTSADLALDNDQSLNNQAIEAVSAPTSPVKSIHNEEETWFTSPAREPSLQDMNATDRLDMISILLHAADISNPARPYRVCKYWSDSITREFQNQADEEMRRGLPVTATASPDPKSQSQQSIDFSDIIVRPFYEALADCFPSFSQLVDILHVNRVKWSNLVPTTPNRGDQMASGRKFSFAAGSVDIPDNLSQYSNRRGTGRGSGSRKTSESSKSGRKDADIPSTRTRNHWAGLASTLSHPSLCDIRVTRSTNMSLLSSESYAPDSLDSIPQSVHEGDLK